MAAYDPRAAAADIGRDHGRNAASWFFDGNTTHDWYVAVRRGLEDGDPEILDQLPPADLSGQWADGYTADDLMVDTAGDEIDRDEIIAAYEDGHSDGVRYEIERAIAAQLDAA